jgi:SNF family Na+-dependent transporter
MSEGLSFILGLFLPPLVEYVKTKFSDNKVVHYTIALLSCAIVGVVSVLIEGKFNTENLDAIVGSIGTALIASQAVYNYYWKPQKLDVKLQSFIKDKNI